jgi:hypothetical protein
MTYGNFYFGKDGFFYKKHQKIGARKNPPIGIICNQPQNVWNKYVPGSGVGGHSVATRRAALYRATKPVYNAPFGQCITTLGLFSKYASSSNNYPLNWYIQ